MISTANPAGDVRRAVTPSRTVQQQRDERADDEQQDHRARRVEHAHSSMTASASITSCNQRGTTTAALHTRMLRRSREPASASKPHTISRRDGHLFIGDVAARAGRRVVRDLVPAARGTRHRLRRGEWARSPPAASASCRTKAASCRRRGRRDHARQLHVLRPRGLAVSRRATATSCGPLTSCAPSRAGAPASSSATTTSLGASTSAATSACRPAARRCATWTTRSRRSSGADLVLVDMHAEATSENFAMGRYLDGKVTAVVGTHTHVLTADAGVLPGGTAEITDGGNDGARGARSRALASSRSRVAHAHAGAL